MFTYMNREMSECLIVDDIDSTMDEVPIIGVG
jgi:hypothetical protein